MLYPRFHLADRRSASGGFSFAIWQLTPMALADVMPESGDLSDLDWLSDGEVASILAKHFVESLPPVAIDLVSTSPTLARLWFVKLIKGKSDSGLLELSHTNVVHAISGMQPKSLRAIFPATLALDISMPTTRATALV